MKKKILALVLVLALVASVAVALVACDDSTDFKFGLICLHGETSTYDKNFIDAAREACDDLGVELVLRTDIPEAAECYNTAVDLVDDGCDLIFADSFGHESYILQAAKEYPDVQFAHATGTTAHTENVANFHNAFASIYEGRYLAGIVAGYELLDRYDDNNDGVITDAEAKVGYVGAHPYAEVVSGYTSFFLGVRSVVENATMEVTYTGSWYDYPGEKTAAQTLIDRGCTLISQHADSMGAPEACEAAGVPNVTYNISTAANCPKTYIAGSKINWAPYFKYIIQCAMDGKDIDTDWTGDFSTDSVVVLDFGANVSEEAKEAVAKAEAALLAGTLEVFDCSTFTVGGERLTQYKADVDTDADFTPDTQVIKTKTVGDKIITYFAESEYRSAPYFDVRIDGITELNN